VWVARLPAVARTEETPAAQGRISLRPLIDQAFEQEEVKLDVFTLTCETLLRHLKNQHERVVAGEIAPRKVHIRLLLPWEKEPLLYPRAKDPADLRVWHRWRHMVQFNLGEVADSADGLRDAGVDMEIEVQRIPAAPQFKLYVLNESEMLFGPYEPLERKIRVPGDDQPVDSLDVLGLGSTLSYHRLDPDRAEGHDSLFFTSMTGWFASNWESWSTIQLRSEDDPAESSAEA
jgi:hypothetical protein